MEIEFSSHEDYIFLNECLPTPIKLNIPEWFKKLEHGKKHDEMVHVKTIKGCVPFLETLTNGYLLRVPVDYIIKHGTTKNDEGKPVLSMATSLDASEEHNLWDRYGLNINVAPPHNPKQLEGSPWVEQNKNLPFPKIMNPWRIKTPPGYSCLFLPPMNNEEQDFFSIIPGIVHTDSHTLEINFPIRINMEKYGYTELNIAKGTPYVQIIPFKRDSWKMKIKPLTTEQMKSKKIWHTSFLHNYKNRIFNKGKTSWT